MGLDMYLTKRCYVKQWDHQSPEEKFSVTVLQGGKALPWMDASQISYVEVEAAYWRKANHIHKWFVQNVQEGKDECQQAYVSEDNCRKLLEACEAVIADPSKAPDILPTSAGFFFGGTEYDEWYMKAVEYTAKVMKDLLAEVSEGGYWPYNLYYRSSW